MTDFIYNDLNTNLRLSASSDNQALLTKTQEIPDSFLKDLDERRHETSSALAKTGDMHLAASIPVAIVEQWMTEGFNIFDPNIGLEAIMKRLRQHDMEKLIASSKRLY